MSTHPTPVRLLLLSVLLCWATSLAAQHSIPFDQGWTLLRRDSVLTDVTLPRAWNEDAAFRVNNAQMPTDTVRYTKSFTLPAEAKGKRVLIEFEGVRQAARVWLNGHYVGLHEDGITAFGFDLTPYIKYKGENHLEVLTDNRWDYREEQTGTTFQWNDKNFNANYGGLRCHVRLHIVGPLYQTLPLYSSFGTTGVYVYATDFDLAKGEATVVVETEVKNDSRKAQQVELCVAVGKVDSKSVTTFTAGSVVIAARSTQVLTARQRLPLQFWAWRQPHLYNVTTTLVADGTVIDSVTTVTGFRKTQFGPDGLLRLNDRVMMVHGYAQRTSNEWPGVGTDVPAWLSDYSNHLMVESGGNLVRWMHTMPWRQDVESCDRVGLPQAMPAGDAEKDASGRQWEQRVGVMTDAIVYNRNNPSILFYECGNKGISEPHMQQMKALRDRFDPHGGRAIGSREMLQQATCAEYGGEMLYINKSATKPVWAMEYCRDEGLRRYWDDWSSPYFHKNGDGPLYRGEPAPAYNLNQDQLAVEHVRRWYDYWQVRPGTGRRVSSGGVKIIFSDTNTHCRGESNYRTSGVVDAMRLPKDSFFAHRVMWNGWVEPEKPDIHVMGHWTYPDGTVKPLYIVSNTDSVAVTLNGTALPAPRRDYQFLFTLDSIHYQPGTLTAVGYNAGKKVCEHTLQTAGPPAEILLSAMTGHSWPRFVSNPRAVDPSIQMRPLTIEMTADGNDMAVLQVEVLDSEGRRCPTYQGMIHFSIEGPAEWRGGIGAGEDNCILSADLPAECGVNRALLRSTTTPGMVRIIASAPGLSPGVLLMSSDPPQHSNANSILYPRFFNNTSGTTTVQPRQVKQAVEVADVTAACNAEQARHACDDDETTEWRNDGRAATAWMTFHFAQPERVDEISLKLTGWRRRSYPIEVVADDGSLLWSGSTPLSLGYVTLPLATHKPLTAITLRLRGTATDSDAFDQVKELAQPVANELDLLKTPDGDRVRHELRIVECDFLKNTAP